MTHSFKEMVVAPILDFFAIFLTGLLIFVSLMAHALPDAFIIISVWLLVLLLPLVALKMSLIRLEGLTERKR